MNTHVRTVLLGALFSVAMSASAQWTWIDKDGRKVFSDRPPPAEVQEKNILKRPAAAASGNMDGNAKAADPSRSARSSAGGSDKELAEKLKAADDADAARKTAEQDRIARVKADNCNWARQARSTYTAGTPLSRINAKGERELVSDEARAAETQRLDSIIGSECN